MTTIRILIYTDDAQFTADPCGEFSISELKKLIKLKTTCIADVHIDLINRHFDQEANTKAHAKNKLTKTFLEPYHEIWFFGFRMKDLPESGEPENELTEPEIDDLEEWMKTGGVLISGDHANQDTSLPEGEERKNHANYLGLGRALGIGVPRAGRLRLWKGPPTAEEEDDKKPIADRDNHNTQEGSDLIDLLEHQSDAVPQHMLLAMRSLPDDDKGRPQVAPHRLFWWYFDKQGKRFVVTKLPDHMHEGQLDQPTAFPPKEWPGTSRPQVIAWGIDKRFDLKFYGLLSAYEGGSDAGRIVADTSWHHFFNINLKGFPRDAAGNPPPGSDLDQIAQFYANLALWLAPRAVRKGLGFDILFELAKSPQVREVKDAEVSLLGNAAKSVLETKIGSSNLLRLFSQSGFEEAPDMEDRLFELAFTGDKSIHSNSMDDLALVSATIQDNFLGTIIRKHHRDLEAAGVVDFGPAAHELISSTGSSKLLEAFKEQEPLIAERLRRLEELKKTLWPSGNEEN
ncbi:MAG TPA: hypothetical protein VGC73_11290 [Pyrinomonadaceae bacterium]